MRIISLLLLLLVLSSCSKTETNTPVKTTPVKAVQKSNLIQINSREQFNQVIASSKLSVVDIYATWCGPCKMIAPILEELATEYNGEIQVVKVDGEKHRDIAQAYKLDAYPTMVLIKSGKELKKIVGFRPKEELKKLIDANK